MGKKPSGQKRGIAYLEDRVLCIDLSSYNAGEREAVISAIRERMGNQLHIDRLRVDSHGKLVTCEVVVSSSRHKDSTPESARKTAVTLVRQAVAAYRANQRAQAERHDRLHMNLPPAASALSGD